MSEGFGHGILEGGRVHPDVTAQIAAARGRGVPLEPAVRAEMTRSVRWLVSACAGPAAQSAASSASAAPSGRTRRPPVHG